MYKTSLKMPYKLVYFQRLKRDKNHSLWVCPFSVSCDEIMGTQHLTEANDKSWLINMSEQLAKLGSDVRRIKVECKKKVFNIKLFFVQTCRH